ncbi:unnamed protein product [Pleuronectes platessa]|uniref:Uncharacterized protein n=1 Tax=Pleuronectes platessa TaxID=8262 RepID=A0A9N7UW61_PLEPL|nr:unnamed protein product [Pleuronectes platessa]
MFKGSSREGYCLRAYPGRDAEGLNLPETIHSDRERDLRETRTTKTVCDKAEAPQSERRARPSLPIYYPNHLETAEDLRRVHTGRGSDAKAWRKRSANPLAPIHSHVKPLCRSHRTLKRRATPRHAEAA